MVSSGFLVKNGEILKSAFFTCLCPKGSQSVAKRPLELFLNVNNALLKIFLFNSYPDFIFCGLILCPWSFGRSTKCLRVCFWTHWFNWELLKEYLYLVEKSTFFKRCLQVFFFCQKW